MSIKHFIEKDLCEESLKSLDDCIKILQSKDNILITGHANPDGDALGSMLAFAYICEALEKNYILYNESETPDFLSFLPCPKEIEHDIDNLSIKPELIVVLDCGDRNRIGEMADKVLRLAPSINIDHHTKNPNFGSLCNWVDISMAATANAVACIALKLGIPLIGNIAFCIYTSLLTDTGSFSHGNTNARALFTAGHLINNGLDASLISSFLNNQWSEEKTKLWGYLMSHYQIDKDLGIVYALVDDEILEKYHADKEDLEGFVEQLRRIKYTRVAALFREKKDNGVKASFRSQHDDNVQLLASYFGGGGHKNASGASFKCSLEEAKNKVLQCLQEHRKEILPEKQV